MSEDPAARDLLLALRDPAALAGFDPARWNRLLPRARSAGLLGRLGLRAAAAGVAAALPPRVSEIIEASQAVTATHERMIRFEVGRIRRALADADFGFVLLKGAAYVMAGLPAARARLVSDVDILVARDHLDAAESRLIEAGWEAGTTDAYDQRYYRQWMHELPPLRHRARQTYVDLHHNILPLSGRLKVDADLLLAAARPIAGLPGVAVLSPPDMVLHNVVHLFQDGEMRHGLRDLVDLDELLRHFAIEPGFWPALAERSAQLGLGRPLHYAINQVSRLLGTEIDPALRRAAAAAAPAMPVDRAVQALMGHALIQSGDSEPRSATKLVREALYIRSHWLRMPPHLLALHLGRKAAVRFQPAKVADGSE